MMKLLKLVGLFLATVCLFAGLAYGLWWLMPVGLKSLLTRQQSQPPIFQTTGPVMQLERLGQLVVLRVKVSDIMIGEGEGYQGCWIVNGDVLIAVDMKRAQIVEKGGDQQHRRATIFLPVPQVLQARLDHNKTRTWTMERTTIWPWGGNPDLLRDESMRRAQRHIECAAKAEEHMSEARDCAENLITQYAWAVNYKIEVRWEDSPPEPDGTPVPRSTKIAADKRRAERQP